MYAYIILQYFIFSSIYVYIFFILLSIVVSQALYFVIFFCLYCFGLNTKNRPDFFGTRCTTKTNNVKYIYSRKYDRSPRPKYSPVSYQNVCCVSCFCGVLL